MTGKPVAAWRSILARAANTEPPTENVVALPAASMDAIAKRIRLAHNELVSAQAAYARLQEDWSRAQQSYEEERRQVVAGMAEIAERERGLQEQLAEIVREHGMLVTVPDVKS